jgi:hypothetical protein
MMQLGLLILHLGLEITHVRFQAGLLVLEISADDDAKAFLTALPNRLHDDYVWATSLHFPWECPHEGGWRLMSANEPRTAASPSDPEDASTP